MLILYLPPTLPGLLPPPGQNPHWLAWVPPAPRPTPAPPPLSCELQGGWLNSQHRVRGPNWPSDFSQSGCHIVWSSILPPRKQHLWGQIWCTGDRRKMVTTCIRNELGWPLITWKTTISGSLVWTITFLYFLTALRFGSLLTWGWEHVKWWMGLAYMAARPGGGLCRY